MNCIRKDIDYFSEKYSLIELFHGIWMSYSQINGCNKVQNKVFNTIFTVTQKFAIRNGTRDFLYFYF